MSSHLFWVSAHPDTKIPLIDVCSPYRAPETIFGPADYDPFAVDLWSFGALCAEFFTPLRFVNSDMSDGGDDDESEEDGLEPLKPFYVSNDLAHDGSWTRDSLFNADRGSIGLAWSIFKIRGTPDDTNWPVSLVCLCSNPITHCHEYQSFKSLPDAGKVTFLDAQSVDLQTLLPNLPPLPDGISYTSSAAHFPPEALQCTPLDLVHRLLVYPPEGRMKASEALQHPWLVHGPLLLPEGHEAQAAVWRWEERTLAEILQSCLGTVSPDPHGLQ